MEMAENEIVHMGLRGEIRSELVKRLVLTLENIVHALGHAALLRPALAETECQIGMQKAEKTLEELGPESPTHELV